MFLVVRNELDHSYSVLEGTKEDLDQEREKRVDLEESYFEVTDLEDLLKHFKLREMVILYNQSPLGTIQKFPQRQEAAERTFSILQEISTRVGKGVKVLNKISLDAKEELFPCRVDTKQAVLVDALKGGCTMADLLVLCYPWVEKSIKSGIYWDVNKVKGYGVKTVLLSRAEAQESGYKVPDKGEKVAVYFLTYPTGVGQPLPHKPRRTAI